MSEIKRLPSTVESRLMEDIFEVFQYDPKRSIRIKNRELAFGTVAIILRTDLRYPDVIIAGLLRCATKSIPLFVAQATAALESSEDLRDMVAAVRKTIAAPQTPQRKWRATKKRKVLEIDEIAALVSDSLNVPLERMQSNDERGLPATNARFIAIAVIRALCRSKDSWEIGAYFHRDQMFVKIAIMRVSAAIAGGSNPVLRRETLRVCAALNLAPEKLIASK